MEKVTFGIIGIGSISHRFVLGLQQCENATLVAVASRSLDKAEQYAKQYNIAKHFGSYQDMLMDPSIDCIYIATPPQQHFEHMMLCLQYGKHVVCEKPFVVDVQQAIEIFSYASRKNLFVMEAQKSIFLPTTAKIKSWLDTKAIGELRYAEASYCYQAEFSFEHYINQAKGGGSLFDVGVYPLYFLDYVIDAPYVTMEGKSIMNQYNVDTLAQILLTYEPNVLASVRCATSVATANVACFYGTKGKIEVEQFWKSKVCRLYLDDGSVEEYVSSFEGEFQFQIRHAADCIQQHLSSSPMMTPERTIKLMGILSTLQRQWQGMLV